MTVHTAPAWTETPVTTPPRQRAFETLRHLERVVRPMVALALLLSVWELWVRVGEVEPFLLPAPSAVTAAGTEHLPYLLTQTWVTLGHIVGGFTAGAAAGLLIASVLSTSSYLRGAVMPLLVAVQAVPKVALAPLLIIWLGFDWESKLALVALLCFFPVVVNTIAGMQSTPAEIVELARSFEAGRWTILRLIRIRYALPQLFVGLKVAITLALIGAVVAQMANPNSGLGAVILRATQAGNMALTFAAITALAATGVALYYTLALIERAALPWNRATTA